MFPYPLVRYRFDDEDHLLLRSLLNFLNCSTPASLLDSIWLDPSLQGWTEESFRKEDDKGPVGIEDELYVDLPEDPDHPDARPWDNARSRRIIILGYYSWAPRRIVLFPNAIELVAGKDCYLDEFNKDIAKARDALTRKVLVHEMAHWFTLDPDAEEQKERIANWKPRDTKSDPSVIAARLGSEQCNFRETTESLADLCSWFAFQNLAQDEDNQARAKELLHTMYMTRNPAASYEYQLYWFWLVFSGIATSLGHLKGEDLLDVNIKKLEGRISEFRDWTRGNDAEPKCFDVVRKMLLSKFDPAPAKEALLPGFSKEAGGYEKAIDGLWARWHQEYLWLKNRGLNDTELGILGL